MSAKLDTGHGLVDLAEVGLRDPRLAVALLGGVQGVQSLAKSGRLGDCAVISPDMIGLGVPDCGAYGWQVLNLRGTFTGTAAGQSIPAQQSGVLNADLWVKDVKYAVERPNAFAGSVLKAQSDYYNSLQPSVDATLIVKGLCQYVISDTPTPLQNLREAFECACEFGMVVGCNTQITANLTLKRALQSDENPYEITISFHGMRLPVSYTSCTIDTAIAALQTLGLRPGA